jgi:hypothetical protein
MTVLFKGRDFFGLYVPKKCNSLGQKPTSYVIHKYDYLCMNRQEMHVCYCDCKDWKCGAWDLHVQSHPVTNVTIYLLRPYNAVELSDQIQKECPGILEQNWKWNAVT